MLEWRWVEWWSWPEVRAADAMDSSWVVDEPRRAPKLVEEPGDSVAHTRQGIQEPPAVGIQVRFGFVA